MPTPGTVLFLKTILLLNLVPDAPSLGLTCKPPVTEGVSVFSQAYRLVVYLLLAKFLCILEPFYFMELKGRFVRFPASAEHSPRAGGLQSRPSQTFARRLGSPDAAEGGPAAGTSLQAVRTPASFCVPASALGRTRPTRDRLRPPSLSQALPTRVTPRHTGHAGLSPWSLGHSSAHKRGGPQVPAGSPGSQTVSAKLALLMLSAWDQAQVLGPSLLPTCRWHLARHPHLRDNEAPCEGEPL